MIDLHANPDVPSATAYESAQGPAPNVLAHGLLVAFVALGALYLLTGFEPLLTLAQLSGMALLLLSLMSIGRAELLLYTLLIGSVIALLLRAIVHGEFYTLVLASYFIAGVGAALILRQQHVSLRALQVIHALVMLWLLWAAVRGVSAEVILPGRSRNHISSLVLALGITVNLVQYRQRGSITLFPAAAALLASTWAVGRSGILASLIYFLGAVWIRRRSLTWIQVTAGLAVAAAIVVWIAVEYGAVVGAFIELSTLKLRTRGLESFERIEIITTYIREIDAKTFLFGQNDDFLGIIGLTLHNSFLQMHYLLGAWAFVMFGAIGLALTRGIRGDRVHLVLLLPILIRAATDTVLYPGILFDAPFLYLLAALLLPQQDGEAHPELPGAGTIHPGDVARTHA